jgi:hypothetical protein
VKAITEELCGHSFSASSISTMNQRLAAGLAQFADRPLAEALPYLILDVRDARVREAGVIVSQAVLIAIGIDWDASTSPRPRPLGSMPLRRSFPSPLDRRPAGRHQRLSCRAQRQPQALPLDQIRQRHHRQTRPLPYQPFGSVH